MAVERRFLIAPSFARLLRRESRDTSRIMEGHFHSQPDECRFIRVEREQAALVLARRGEDGMMLEDVAVIPHRQAEALMDVAAGTAARRVAERSDITPKHLRRLEREARRAIFRQSTSDDEEGAARMAQALAPHMTPLH